MRESHDSRFRGIDFPIRRGCLGSETGDGGVEITRLDVTAAELRAASGQARSAGAARPILALVLDRATAARSCGMDLQTLRDQQHVRRAITKFMPSLLNSQTSPT